MKRKKLKQNLINIFGWRTNRKIVVIESDDWGTIRMASKNAYNRFLKKGYAVDKCCYNQNDSLESNSDLELLFDVLNSVKDKNGNPAIFTANNIVANPDFKSIKESGYRQYYYESFLDTLKGYPNHDRVESLYKEGINKKLIKPQFHGREHVNVNRWLADLRKGRSDLHDAFERAMFTIHSGGKNSGRKEYLDAFGHGYSIEDEIEKIENVLTDGFRLFKDIWGFSSCSFIAPCYTWHPEIETILLSEGVQFIQGNWVQIVPSKDGSMNYKKIRHFQGQQAKNQQRYLIRNVQFEPVENLHFDSVNSALNQIQTAFKWKKPALIGSHRVNYIGSINPENRSRNLKKLKELLKVIKRNWADVEFMTSDELGFLMNK